MLFDKISLEELDLMSGLMTLPGQPVHEVVCSSSPVCKNYNSVKVPLGLNCFVVCTREDISW